MDKKWIALGAVILSVIACVVSGVALLRQPPASVVLGAGPDSNTAQLRELEKQLADLRAAVEHIAGDKLERPESHIAREPVVTTGTSTPDVQARLTSLEESVATLLRQSQERTAKARADSRAEPAAKDPQLVAVDPRASEQEKLAALKALRGTTVDGQDARSHDVVLALLDVAERSADESVRLDTYRNLHGVQDPSVRDSMLRALANDPSAKVRKKVAQDIDTFLPDAQVASALRQAADYDSDQGVRDQAGKTLSGAH